MRKKLKAGILGATGAAGQEFLEVLQDHPYFEVERLYASSKSSGKKLGECEVIADLSQNILNLVIQDGDKINTQGIYILFSAVEMPEKEKIKEIEG
ncbi:MAG: aspartate-semialdehyde dehydrogenase, partial [Candidatus Firestonebacteria bacterium]|nr:aspartate-semialdehyde dehydrogenase [Candidatus Firestonebacteria bacterium]